MLIRRSVASIFFVLALSAVSASADPILSVTPASQTVNIGDTVTVNIDITDVVDLFGYQFDLAFDPSILSFQSIVEGSFPGGSTFFFVTDDPLTPGTVEFIANAVVGPIGIDGSGTLAIATFLATMPGTALITVPNPQTDSNLLFLDSNFAAITFSAINPGRVQVNQSASPVPDEPSLMILLAASLSLAACRCVIRPS